MAKVYWRHGREMGYCAPAMVSFIREQGMNPRDFHESRGVDSEIMRATGNRFAIAVAELAEKEELESMRVADNG